MRLWNFEALDRWFFRGPHPFNAGETQWLASEFLPSARVMQGAVRSAIGEHLAVDWNAFRGSNGKAHRLGEKIDLVEQIGDAGSLGRLRLAGPFLYHDNELLFPAPLDLYRAQDDQCKALYGLFMPSSKPVKCDIGDVRLPQGRGKGIKTLEGRFVTKTLIADLLKGETNSVEEARHTGAGEIAGGLWPLYPPEDNPKSPALADLEPKIGLMRDNDTRRHKEGMLYGIALVRPRKDVALAMLVDGMDDRLHPTAPMTVPLGGEGKLARLSVETWAPERWPVMPGLKQTNGKLRFKLVLITPARMPVVGWLPQGFPEEQENGAWSGVINGVRCTIVSACIGKAVKIGGWNLAGGVPRPLQSFVPAGSVYFCETDANYPTAVTRLHHGHIGGDTEYGFGHMLVGTW